MTETASGMSRHHDVTGLECPAPTLDALITMALEDIMALEGHMEYEYYPEFWHTGIGTDKAPYLSTDRCQICLAGAILARRFEIPSRDEIGREVAVWMQALEEVRSGSLTNALCMFYPDMDREQARHVEARIRPEENENLPGNDQLTATSDWGSDREGFLSRMAEYRRVLGQEGL